MGMSTFPNRAQIEQAEPVQFAERAPDTTITIHAQIDGWPVDIAYRGKLEQLPAALARLASAGLQPTQAGQAVQAAPKAKRQTVEPIYQPDGTPCCPVHKKPLREGTWGMHCTAKDEGPDSKNGYCGLRFEA